MARDPRVRYVRQQGDTLISRVLRCPSQGGWNARAARRGGDGGPLLDEALQAARQRHRDIAGAQALDVRDPEAFDAAHLSGSINVGLEGAYATWAGTVLDSERPIVLIADPGREEEAAMRLGRIGFDHIAGYLDGGASALEGRADLLRRIDRMTAAEVAAALATSNPPLVLDVRAPGERQDKHIAGSLHLPLNRLQRQLDEAPRDRKVILQCAGGYRSAIAASILANHGWTEIADMVGGLAAWEEMGLDLVAPDMS